MHSLQRDHSWTKSGTNVEVHIVPKIKQTAENRIFMKQKHILVLAIPPRNCLCIWQAHRWTLIQFINLMIRGSKKYSRALEIFCAIGGSRGINYKDRLFVQSSKKQCFKTRTQTSTRSPINSVIDSNLDWLGLIWFQWLSLQKNT